MPSITLNNAKGLLIQAGSGTTISNALTKADVTNTSVGASTAAAGNATGNAGALPAGTAQVYLTTAADDTKGVILSTSDAVKGRVVFVANGVSNKVLKIYPPSGGSINGASANAAFSTVLGAGAILICTDATSGATTWAGF